LAFKFLIKAVGDSWPLFTFLFSFKSFVMDCPKLFLPVILVISTAFVSPDLISPHCVYGASYDRGVNYDPGAKLPLSTAGSPERLVNRLLVNEPAPIKWIIESGCSLKVAGTTNVSKFNCSIMSYAKPDTLSICKNTEGKPLKILGKISVPVKTFDCKHAMITKDLRKTLKAESFPNLVIRFISLSKYPQFTGQHQAIKGLVSIELAGESRQYEVDYQFSAEGNKNLNLVGTRKVKFSDFNLTPPKKAGGMIRTNDELAVEFNLKIKVI
jgi:hypothetical protein